MEEAGNLLFTVWKFVKAYLAPTVESKCLPVKASIVGGLRDNERRQASESLLDLFPYYL
jgi:hypothetical protein